MDTKQIGEKRISEMVDEASKRAVKRVNDEFIRTSMEHRNRELSQKQQGGIDVTGTERPCPPVENQT
jgi:hypothetical protein